MYINLTQFGDSSSGLGAFNVNWKSFLFQLATFLIVLLIFKRWILPPITKTLNERRSVLEQSLEQARKTKEELAAAEAKVEEMLNLGRTNADKILAGARDEAKAAVAKAEEAAKAQAQRIMGENESQLAQAKDRIREELKDELGNLVVETTEKILRQKLTAQADLELIKRSVRELKR